MVENEATIFDLNINHSYSIKTGHILALIASLGPDVEEIYKISTLQECLPFFTINKYHVFTINRCLRVHGIPFCRPSVLWFMFHAHHAFCVCTLWYQSEISFLNAWQWVGVFVTGKWPIERNPCLHFFFYFFTIYGWGIDIYALGIS